MNSYYEHLTTEKTNPSTQFIDECDTRDMLLMINDEDQLVPPAVRKEIDAITAAVDRIYASLKNGGRMFYVGAGTSGRLGVLDASECPPTYGTPPELVQAYIAGGDAALRSAVEGCEDDEAAGAQLIADKGVASRDVVIGITASGSTPYVLGAVRRAKAIGAGTIGITTNRGSRISEWVDICIAPVVGPEVVAGSTRLKSGTAQKLVLNMLTTGVMIKLGKVYNNLMVDLQASNAKLHDRSIRIVRAVTGVSEQEAVEALKKANLQVKTAIMMIETGTDARTAEEILQRHEGRLKAAIQSVKAGKRGPYDGTGLEDE
jgi:N-acetylmuramic acid 6-phosphate etherase